MCAYDIRLRRKSNQNMIQRHICTKHLFRTLDTECTEVQADVYDYDEVAA